MLLRTRRFFPSSNSDYHQQSMQYRAMRARLFNGHPRIHKTKVIELITRPKTGVVLGLYGTKVCIGNGHSEFPHSRENSVRTEIGTV